MHRLEIPVEKCEFVRFDLATSDLVEVRYLDPSDWSEGISSWDFTGSWRAGEEEGSQSRLQAKESGNWTLIVFGKTEKDERTDITVSYRVDPPTSGATC